MSRTSLAVGAVDRHRAGARRTVRRRTARATCGKPAAAQPVTKTPPAVLSLHTRLNDNAAVLLAAYRASAEELERGRGVVPAAEWLLDNYHLVEEQIREIRDDLPPLLPSVAQACRRSVRRVSARVRCRVGVRCAYRQPRRPADPAAFHQRVSTDSAADNRRIVGRGDHVAHRADREPATPD